MFLNLWSSTSGSQSHGSFKGIINPPLEAGQGTDHENSGSQTSPKSSHTNFTVDFGHILT